LGVVDRSFPRLDHDRHVVDAAEILIVLVRDLDEGMILRQQIAEARDQLGLRCVVAEEGSERADDGQHDEAPAKNPFSKSVPGHCVLRSPPARALALNPDRSATSCRRPRSAVPCDLANRQRWYRNFAMTRGA